MHGGRKGCMEGGSEGWMYGGISRKGNQEPEMEERRKERSELGRDGGCREGERAYRPDQLSIACSIPFSPLAMNPPGSSPHSTTLTLLCSVLYIHMYFHTLYT